MQAPHLYGHFLWPLQCPYISKGFDCITLKPAMHFEKLAAYNYSFIE